MVTLNKTQMKSIRQAIFDRTLVGTPKQRKVAQDLLFYLNLWGDLMSVEIIHAQIDKSINRWTNRFPPKPNKKGEMVECSEVKMCHAVRELFEQLVTEEAKKDAQDKEKEVK